jgi:hypothetical protein
MNALFPDKKLHLVGDLAYPLMPYLLKGFNVLDLERADENRFDTMLSSCRQVIERVFGVTKGKFKWLKYLDVNSPEKACDIITACCALYNFGQSLQDNDDFEEVQEEVPNDLYDDSIDKGSKALDMACAKRLQIMQQLANN